MDKIKQYIYNRFKNTSPTIIEAGAAEGYDTVEFSNMFPSGQIYAFEPAPLLYNMAYDKIKDRINVILNNMALAESTGKKEMVLADRFGIPWGSSSLLKPKQHLENNPDITFKNTTLVQTINLDEFIRQENINNIDFMWLDMQGYEPVVLQHAPNSLKMAKYIYSEINLVENYDGNMIYPDFKLFMEENNFKVVFEDFLTNPKNEIDGGNVLFANTQI